MMERVGVLALAMIGCSTQVLAQTTAEPASAAPQAQAPAAAEAPTSGDIVVTAQRREERLQDVPISVTAVSGNQLSEAGIDDITELQRLAPSLFVSPAGRRADARIAVRGIGSAGVGAVEPSVAAFVDGIYLARAGAVLSNLFDVERIEVLNGPQGTLFGRNATVGALSIVTQQPRFENSGGGTLEYGTFDRVRIQPFLNVAASDKLAFRVSGLYDRNDPYVRNELTGRKVANNYYRGVRLSGRYLNGPFDWVLRGDYQRTTGDGQTNFTVVADTVTPTAAANFANRTRGLNPILDATYAQRIRQTSEGYVRDRNRGLASDMSLRFGDGYVLRALTGYRRLNSEQFEQDITGTGLSVAARFSAQATKTFTQELQLLSPTDQQFSYIAGLYYLDDRYDAPLRVDQGPDFCGLLVANAAQRAVCASGRFPTIGAAGGGFNQKTRSVAGYGQATFNFTPELALTAGGRYTHDKKSLALTYASPNPFLASLATADTTNRKLSDGRFTYRLSGTYKPSNDILIFANFSTGFKSGGFDTAASAAAAASRVFDLEKSDNVELGFKSQFLDRRLTANVTLFRLTVDGFQLRSFNPAISAFNVRNAGSVRQQGVDFDLSVRPVSGLTIGTVLTVLDSKYTTFKNAPNLPGLPGVQDLTGLRATFSPKYRGVVSADYRRPVGDGLEASLSTDLTFTSKANIGLEADNNRQGIERGYALLGARIGLGGTNDRWQVYVQGENLTDQGYCTSRFAQLLGAAFGVLDGRGGSAQRCFVGLPRTVRVGVSTRF